MDSAELKNVKATVTRLLVKERLDTPFLVFDESHIQTALSKFQKFLPRAKLFYATKANSDSNILSFLAKAGLSFDVASIGEIEAISALGVGSERMFLSTPVKSDETIKGLLSRRIGACAVDTSGEVDRLAKWCMRMGNEFRPKIFVRFKVESKQVEVNLNTKFGCSCSEAIDIVHKAVSCGFEIGGLCFHVGTQCLSPDNYFLSIGNAMLVAEEVQRRFGICIPVINIGGGFCDPKAAAVAGVNLDEYYRAIGKACERAERRGFEIYVEPGRCLVSSAGTLVSTVIGTNVRDGRNWAYLNEGIYGCYSIKLYEHPEFSFIPLPMVHRSNDSTGRDSTPWTLAGPTCDSLDVIAENVDFLVPLEIGDILMTPNMGAYTLGTANNFNGFSIAKVIMTRGGRRDGGTVVSIVGAESLRGHKVGNR